MRALTSFVKTSPEIWPFVTTMQNAEECLSLTGFYYHVLWEFHWPYAFAYVSFYCCLSIMVFWDYIRMNFFLVVNKWVMLFILFSTGPYTCQMRGPLSCIPSPLLSNFISTSFDTSHSLEQHGVGLLQDGGKFTFCLLNSLPSFQISLGVAGSGKCIKFIFL